MAYYFYKENNILELHYWLEGSSHSMDAFVQNKCEQEFLKLLKLISESFNTTLIIQTEPLEPGGLKRKYKITQKDFGNKAAIKTAVITALLTGILANPITTSITKISEKIIENAFKDIDQENREEEKEKLEIIKLKQEIQINSNRLQESSLIEKGRANFYKQLEKEPSVEKVSFVLLDENENRKENEIFVDREKFRELKEIRDTPKINLLDDIIPLKVYTRIEETKLVSQFENVSIEITSPNFTNSGKWEGIYNGSLITFKIKSNEFNKLIQSGSIQFKKGTSITCSLIETKAGNDIIYEVLTVDNYEE